MDSMLSKVEIDLMPAATDQTQMDLWISWQTLIFMKTVMSDLSLFSRAAFFLTVEKCVPKLYPHKPGYLTEDLHPSQHIPVSFVGALPTQTSDR